jgi:hypothetical protein
MATHLNAVYFLDPYPSRPVVAIDPLAYFRRCGKRVALRLVMQRTEVGYVLVGLAAVLWAAS